ncbi:hypothetical protein Lser_V15G43920 [Lactuca serriola]
MLSGCLPSIAFSVRQYSGTILGEFHATGVPTRDGG